MNKHNDGGPAFPLNRTVGPTDGTIEDARAYGTLDEGMSLRHYFAVRFAAEWLRIHGDHLAIEKGHQSEYKLIERVNRLGMYQADSLIALLSARATQEGEG